MSTQERDDGTPLPEPAEVKTTGPLWPKVMVLFMLSTIGWSIIDQTGQAQNVGYAIGAGIFLTVIGCSIAGVVSSTYRLMTKAWPTWWIYIAYASAGLMMWLAYTGQEHEVRRAQPTSGSGIPEASSNVAAAPDFSQWGAPVDDIPGQGQITAAQPPTKRGASGSDAGTAHLVAQLGQITQLDARGIQPVGKMPQLRVFTLAAGVRMPFPGQPSYAGSFDQDALVSVRSHLYSLPDTENMLGFSATVMEGPNIRTDADIQSMLANYLASARESMGGGDVVHESPGSIDGKPARTMVVHMDQFAAVARSHTVAIYDSGRFHSWAVQDIPELTGDRATRLFTEGLSLIRVP